MFRIEVPEQGRQDLLYSFMDLCEAYIAEQQDNDLDLDLTKAQKIVRLIETGGTAGFEDELDELLKEDELDVDPLVDVETTSSEHDEDNDKPFWAPQDTSRTDVVKLLPGSVLESIASETTCVLTLDAERSCVFITNATESKVQAVVKKLDNLERCSVIHPFLLTLDKKLTGM